MDEKAEVEPELKGERSGVLGAEWAGEKLQESVPGVWDWGWGVSLR